MANILTPKYTFYFIYKPKNMHILIMNTSKEIFIKFMIYFFYFFVMKSNTPLIKVKGWTGQPGIYKSTGYFSKNSLFKFSEF